MERSDGAMATAAQDALRDLRGIVGMNADDITVSVCDGVAVLSGHVTTSTNKLRAGQAVGEVLGAQAVQNELMVDDNLRQLVTQALADDERTQGTIILVSVRQGIVTLNSHRNSQSVRAAAEECVAQIPYVRGISNLMEARGGGVNDVEQPIMQLRIGQEVFARDMPLGRVTRLIMHRHNRRVTAIVVQGRFPDQKQAAPHLRSLEIPMQVRQIVIPISAIEYLTMTLVQLRMGGTEVAQYEDFAVMNFTVPHAGWGPPYPFALSECLWTSDHPQN